MIKENYCIFAISFVYFFLEITLYGIVHPIGLHRYWVIIPILLYIILKFYRKFVEKNEIHSISIEISNILALFMLYIVICNEKIYDLIWNKYSFFSFLTCIILLSVLIIKQDIIKKTNEENKRENNYLIFSI